MPGATDPITKVMEIVHAQFLGRARHRLHRIPSFYAVFGARPVTDHSLANPPSTVEVRRIIVDRNLMRFQLLRVRCSDWVSASLSQAQHLMVAGGPTGAITPEPAPTVRLEASEAHDRAADSRDHSA